VVRVTVEKIPIRFRKNRVICYTLREAPVIIECWQREYGGETPLPIWRN
jgi:hypothetical protein